MKKNVVGRVLAQKQPLRSRISSLHIPAWLLCLFLSILIWLSVTNLSLQDQPEEESSDTVTTVEDRA